VTKYVYMEWNSDTLREARLSGKLTQSALAKELGVHWRTVQNWEKGKPIPISVIPALDKLLGTGKDFVPRKEYDKVLAALNSATDLNRKLTDIIQSSLQSSTDTRIQGE
jgi:transcriptional regulator with XRE-family HTH domain